MNIDCQNIQYSESTRSNKFSVRIVSNYRFESWDIQCKFMKEVFSQVIELGMIDKEIYKY